MGLQKIYLKATFYRKSNALMSHFL